jgi:hypothetical protein
MNMLLGKEDLQKGKVGKLDVVRELVKRSKAKVDQSFKKWRDIVRA